MTSSKKKTPSSYPVVYEGCVAALCPAVHAGIDAVRRKAHDLAALRRFYSCASVKTSLDPVVSDLRMIGTSFFRSSWKSRSGPSEGLPVAFNNPEISPLLSTLGSPFVEANDGFGGLAGVSFCPKSMRSSCVAGAGAFADGAACGAVSSVSTRLDGMAFALFTFCPARIG